MANVWPPAPVDAPPETPAAVSERAADSRPGRVTVLDVVIALAIAGAAAWLRRRQLGPPSLWTDDAWPTLVTRVGWSDVPVVGLTAPGFAAILKAWLHVTGFSATNAQSVAFTFGIAGPALLWLLCVARGLGRAAAAVGAAFLVTSPASVVYSARVKQYTLDAVVVIVLLWLAWRLLDAVHERSRWIVFTVAAIGGTAISSSIVPVVCGGYLAAVLTVWRADRTAFKRAALHSGVFAAFGALWWIAVLRPRLGHALHEYWRSFYFQTTSPLDFVKSVTHTPTRFDHGFTDVPSIVVIVLVLAAGVACWKTRPRVAVLLFTPVLVAVAMALLQLAPLGTGRTDLYLYPVVAVLIAVGASELVRRVTLPGVLVVITLIAAMAASAKAPSAYPQEDMKKATEALVAQAQPGDAIMVYYGGRYAFALYSPWPVSVYPTASQTDGFDVRIKRDHVILLPNYSDRSRYPASVKRLSAHYKRLWFIGTHGHGDVVVVEESLVAAGFDSHSRYYKGRPVFLSLWRRS
jgi:Dolichyl-phosphate-mannose-protein mannosyltransferase